MLLKDKIKQINSVFYEIIKNAYESNKLSHAYLLSGDANTFLNEYADFLAQVLISPNPFSDEKLSDLENYIDFHKIDGREAKKEVLLNQIGALNETAIDVKNKKIMIIFNVESLSNQSLNALLKFLEEPTKNTFIILTTNHINKLLSTIKSRSQIIKIKHMGKDALLNEMINDGIDEKDASILVAFNSASEEAKKNLSEFHEAKNNVEKILKNALIDGDNFFIYANKFINEKNCFIYLNVLKVFLNDIWRLQEGMKTRFTNQELIEKYITIEFNYSEAIIMIGEFFEELKSKGNIKLMLTKLLLRLKELYE